MSIEAPLRLTGRSTSHFTRVAAMFAHELGVPFVLDVVRDLTTADPAAYAENPALKIPTLRVGDTLIFGTENICRRLAAIAGRTGDPRVVFPDRMTSDLARNAQELVWHAMAAQVTLRLGVNLSKLPPDNVFFVKARAGLAGALAWLDAHAGRALAELPDPRDLSLFEVALFCVVEHVAFFPTVPLDVTPRLVAWSAGFGDRESARLTPYRIDR